MPNLLARLFQNAPSALNPRPCPIRCEELESREVPAGIFIAGVGGATQAVDPEVSIYATRGAQQNQRLGIQLEAFEGTSGDTRIAVGDVNGDGTDDIIAAGGVGGSSEVRIFDGADALAGKQTLLSRFFAYSNVAEASQAPGFQGGVYVAAGDLNGDGFAELFTTPGQGGRGHVKVWDFNGGGAFLGNAPVLRASVYTFADYDGEVRVASLRIGRQVHLVTASGAGVPGDVRLFNSGIYNLGSVPDRTPVPAQFLLARLVPFGGYSGGLSVAAGDTNGDGTDELFVSKNDGSSIVEVYDAGTLSQAYQQGNVSPVPLGTFEAFAGFLGQVRLGAADVDGDGKVEVLTTTGFSGDPQGTPVKAWARSGNSFASVRSFYSNPGYLPGAWLHGTDFKQGYSAFTKAIGADKLGQPLGRPVQVPDQGIEYREYEHGTVVGTVERPLVATTGEINAEWKRMGGVNSDLGFPVSDAFVFNRTVVQDFKNGWMMSDPRAGVLAVVGSSSTAMPMLLDKGAMVQRASEFALWTPIIDDVKTAGGDVAGVFKPETVYEDRRTHTDPQTGATVPAVEPAPPAPFHYDPTLLKNPPTGGVRLRRTSYTIWDNGNGYEMSYYSSLGKGTTPRAYWGEQSRELEVLSTFNDRLSNLSSRLLIREDPVFRLPTKFILVDQIYDLKTGEALGQFSGQNQLQTRWRTTNGVTIYSAARIIQIRAWDANANSREQAVRTLVHELGHSLNSYDPDNKLVGSGNTLWTQNHRKWFNDFMALSGWTNTGTNKDPVFTHDPKLQFNADLSKSAFASDYAANGPRNRDGTYVPSPNEDWAETFELASRPNLNVSSLSSILQKKVKLVKDFLALVVPRNPNTNAVDSSSVYPNA